MGGVGDARNRVSDEEWSLLVSMDWRVAMPHRRTSGAKVRSHKIGIGNSRYMKGKQARLQNRRLLQDLFRLGE